MPENLLPSIWTTALTGCCPACGRGRMFSGYLTIAAECSFCHLKLGEHDSGDGPAVLLIFILGALVVPMALWVASVADWPLWFHTIIWGVVILGMTVGMLRPAKALTLAAQYRRNAAGPDWHKS